MALKDVKETFVALTLDKPRNLKFDLNAFALLEDTYGTMNAVRRAENRLHEDHALAFVGRPLA